MKKIWYLSNADKKDKRVARLFVYENNGQQKAQLDLTSFADKPEFSKAELYFYIPQNVTVETLLCQPKDPLLTYALKGKGIMPKEFAQIITEAVRNLQLRIVWGGKLYDSFSCTEQLPPLASVKEPKETEESKEAKEAKEAEEPKEPEEAKEAEEPKEPKEPKEPTEKDEQGPAETDTEISYEFDTKQNAFEAQKEDIRKVVELAVLEEEMIFRSFVHNSFLLHGYYNYGHLVIDEKEGRARLGVPGNYYEREKAVASMFGFSDFEPAKNETVVNGTFGYYFTAYT